MLGVIGLGGTGVSNPPVPSSISAAARPTSAAAKLMFQAAFGPPSSRPSFFRKKLVGTGFLRPISMVSISPLRAPA
jgi:hypothetical protein